MINKFIGVNDILYQELHSQTQYISNATKLIKSTKELLDKLREYGCNDLLKLILSFGEKHDFNMRTMCDIYLDRTHCPRLKKYCL